MHFINPTKQSFGLTMIELVITIALISILAVTAYPSFKGKGTFEEEAIRNQLISELRLAQLYSMNRTTGGCSVFIIEYDRFGIPSDCGADLIDSMYDTSTGEANNGFGVRLLSSDSRFQSNQILNNNTGSHVISFNSQGVPGGECDGGCTISVVGQEQTSNVCVKSQGYVHSC